MRKSFPLFAVPLLIGASLVGCATVSAPSGCERPAASSDQTANLITTSGDVGTAPTVDMRTPLLSPETTWVDTVVGDGPQIVSNEQGFVIDATIYDGGTGEPLSATAYNGSLASVSTIDGWVPGFPGFADALMCASEGTRVAAVLGTAGGVSEAALQQFVNLDGTPVTSIVAVIDVQKVYLPHAEGSLVYSGEHGLPSVVRAADGRPGITVPSGDAPSDLVVQQLIAGDGETINDETIPVVQYTGVLWDGGTVFDSSWENGSPVAFPLDSVVPGFADGLRGASVGSQVLIVIPPDQGYGEQGSGVVPPGATLVFVVDIVGAIPAETAQ